ncbi:MAG TPA: fatty acid--CoA ligase, partial [Paracoccaceae bacterium]|nr:fatty acid--CoA ligase [Paracoccaceae bacterium]
ISSLKLENTVSTVPGVREVAAIGVPDARWGERPALILAMAEADAETVSAAARQAVEAAVARGTLSKWAMPDRIMRVEALPKTSVGKIDKKTIRAAVAAGTIA